MTDNVPAPDQALPPAADRSRRRLRLAAIGGIAAIAILGGGITAVASASAPTTTTTTLDLSTSSATSPTGGAVAPSTGATSGTKAAPTPPVHKPHMDGTVTSVSGTTVLIKDHDGFTRTIVLSSKTTYNDGLTAALKVGAKIRAEGTVDANGTSLDATVVSIDNGPKGGPGGPGGPGGHGPRGDRPAPPADGGPAGKAPDGKAPAAPGQSSGTGTATPPSSSAPQTTK